MMKWIDIEKGTPDLIMAEGDGFSWESRRCLVFSRICGTVIARYYTENKDVFWWSERGYGDDVEEVTHWMYLPFTPQHIYGAWNDND